MSGNGGQFALDKSKTHTVVKGPPDEAWVSGIILLVQTIKVSISKRHHAT